MREPWRPDRSDADAREGRPEELRPHVGLLLIEFSDVAGLRQQHGVRAVERFATTLLAQLRTAFPPADVTLVGRGLIELCIVGPTRSDVVETIARVRAMLSNQSKDGVVARTDVGFAVAPGDAIDDPDLYDCAEAALAHDRRRATGPDDDEVSATELMMAIERDEFVLHYQPKLHLRHQVVASVEALIRWHHPVRGLIPPGAFIPAAESTGAIGALTLWTLRQVVADQREMRSAGFDLPVFVNIAGALLSDIGFIATVLALVAESGVKFGFEITETSVIREPEKAIAHLHQLAGIGIAIAIDDYGAGLSSLAYLKQLPASELKIDKLFVTQLASSHRDPLIVRSTIDLAHALEMEVVAEGVETATALALLSVMGCDLVQGYLISRPLTLTTLITFLENNGHLDATEQARSPFGRLALLKASA